MVSTKNIWSRCGILLLIALVVQSGCSCQPQPGAETVSQQGQGSQSGKGSSNGSQGAGSGTADRKDKQSSHQDIIGSIGTKKDSSGTENGSGSGTQDDSAENIFQTSAASSGSGSSSSESGEVSGSAEGSSSRKGTARGAPKTNRFSVGTVIDDPSSVPSGKAATLSPKELTAKARDALEESQRMVKQQSWSKGFQSASMCWEYLAMIPPDQERDDVKNMREQCTRVLKKCSSHMDPPSAPDDDKVIVIE